MTDSRITIGMDRYIAKRWADYALDLFMSDDRSEDPYVRLQSWLSSEIKGHEVMLKTASQARNLWLANDQHLRLRESAVTLLKDGGPTSRPILHYGMALNVFPVMHDLSTAIGRMIQLKGSFRSKEIQQRLLEKYGTPSTIERVTNRGIQTLIDWGFLAEEKKVYCACHIEISQAEEIAWFMQALLSVSPANQLNFSDLQGLPELLGIVIQDIRAVIRESDRLRVERNGRNEEVVVLGRNE